ncbi:AI-2E family transporter [Microbacterium sp. NPDC060132]|uniref:AI-2E family transporter n=1 Tax=unclassified Microbacterium TaxID=2609290 RepID=UPI0036616026
MTTSPTSPERVIDGSLSPSLRVLLALAAGAVALAGLSVARDVFSPLALAVVIVVVCDPVRRPFGRRGWPAWTGSTAVIVVSIAILVAMGALLWLAGIQFAGLIGDLATDGSLRRTADDLVALLQSLGLEDAATDTAASVLDPETLLAAASRVGGTVVGVATALFFVCAYIVFLAVDAARYQRAGEVFGTTRRASIERITRLNRACAATSSSTRSSARSSP